MRKIGTMTLKGEMEIFRTQWQLQGQWHSHRCCVLAWAGTTLESCLCSLILFCSSLIRSSIIVPTWQGGNGQSGEGMPASWSGSRPCVCSHCAMQQPCWVSPGTPCGPGPCSGDFALPGWGLLLWLLPAHSVASPSRFSSAPFECNVTDGVTGRAAFVPLVRYAAVASSKWIEMCRCHHGVRKQERKWQTRGQKNSNIKWTLFFYVNNLLSKRQTVHELGDFKPKIGICSSEAWQGGLKRE